MLWNRFSAEADPAPSGVVAQRNLVAVIRGRLTAKERWLVDQRLLDRGWVELARETGDSPSTLRMLHARALARVRQQLGE
jgi:hypothetical protein